MKVKSLEPTGHRVLIKPEALEEVTAGGIVLPTQDKKRKEQAQTIGTVVKVGKQAWREFSDGQPWANVGDRVLFQKFGGYEIEVEGVLHRVMNDEDVTAVIEE